MISKQQFSDKYQKVIAAFSHGTNSPPEFEDNKTAQNICLSMLQEIDFTKEEAELILFGKNQFGGAKNYYSDEIINRIYKNCLRWFKLPFYEIGFDKGMFPFHRVTRMEFHHYSAPFNYNCAIAYNDKVIVCATDGNFYYGKAIFREREDFLQFVEELIEQRGNFNLLCLNGSCDNAEYFVDGFSATPFLQSVKKAGWTK